MKDRKLIFFGTDGVRGSIDNEVNPESVLKLGHAAGRHFKLRFGNNVLIGKDTRISGYMIESALESGFIPAEMNPDSRADSIIYPEILVSFPINTLLPNPISLKIFPAAHPSFTKNNGFILVSTAPLIPSVPKRQSKGK
jgi:hypothetical protein